MQTKNFALIVLFVAVLFCHGMAIDPPHKICSVAECVNSGNSDLSSAILCNGCTAKALSDSIIATQFHKFQETFRSVLDLGPKKLANLNDDVLSLIVDRLDVMSMLNLLKAYPDQRLSAVAKDSFRRRFRDYKVFIDHRTNSKGIAMENKKPKRINVSGRKPAIRMLQQFGSVIPHIEMDALYDFGKFIVQYASKSLQCLTLKVAGINTFQVFNKPFEQLEQLSLNVKADMKAGNLTFHQIFPKLHGLKLDLESDVDYGFVVGAFPHLKRLEMYVRSGQHVLDKWYVKGNFKELLRKNPQIQSLGVNEMTQDFCNVVNEQLTNLEYLSVSKVQVVNETRCEYVKQFRIREFFNEPMDHISFPRLESLQIDYFYRRYSADTSTQGIWMEFFKRHTNINQLQIQMIDRAIRSEALIQMFNELPNLVEITLKSYDQDANTIPVIIPKNQKLVKFNLIRFCLWDRDLRWVFKTLRNEWKITYENRDFALPFSCGDLLFERKI